MAVTALVSTVLRVSLWFATLPNMSENAWARMAAARCCSGVVGRVRQIGGMIGMHQDKAVPTEVIHRHGRSSWPVGQVIHRPASVGLIM